MNMPTHQTLILTRRDVSQVLDIKQSIVSVEKVFKEYALKKAFMPPKVYLRVDKYHGDFRAMPAFSDGLKAACVKWVNVHPGNKSIGLPTVMGVIILSDPKTGFPLCIMDGTYVTSIRTAAAGAVAAKYLARKDSKIVALVGCGVQAGSQLLALKEVVKIREVYVYGPEEKLIKNFIKDVKKFCPCPIFASKNVESCVKDADIIVTTTPSRKPLVYLKWLKKGVHINAIGADAKGKQELQADILKKASVVIDDWAQASHSGEINVPLSRGAITKKNITATMGEVVCGAKVGRRSLKDITVFDSTGLAIQDVAVASLVYRAALKRKKGKWVQLI